MNAKLVLLAFACCQPSLGAGVPSCAAGGSSGPHCSQDPGLLSDDNGVLSLLQREAALLRQKVVGSDPSEADAHMLSLLQLVTTDGGMSSATSLLQTVKELAMADVQGEFQADPISVKVLESIITFMKESVIATTVVNHQEDQKEIQRAIDGITNCTTTMQGAFSAADTGVNALKQKQVSASGTHATCRGEQVTLNSTKVSECDDFTSYSDGLEGSKPACLCSFPAGPSDEMLACIQSAATWATLANSTYMAKDGECDTATTNLNNKKTTCDANQKAFESAFCSYGQALTTTCSEYTTCRKTTTATYKTVSSDVAVSEAARKAEHVAAKKVICFVGVFKAAKTAKPKAFDDCNAETYSTTHLDIEYPPAPAAETCDVSPVDDKPCDSEWVSTNYAGKPWSTQAPATACSACR